MDLLVFLSLENFKTLDFLRVVITTEVLVLDFSGVKSVEVHCYNQLSNQSRFNPVCSDTANVQSKESSDKDRAREPSDIQRRNKDTNTDDVRIFFTYTNTFRLEWALVSAKAELKS